MSHELLVLAGESSGSARARRRQVVTAAATRVPRMHEVEVHETHHACVGVVATAPSGGDVATVDATGEASRGALRATVALTGVGVTSAASEQGQLDGAEAGHATVLVHDDGTVDLGTDGFATVSLYWGVAGDRLVASTHLASLVSLGLDDKVDRSGILQYLSMLHPLGSTTILEGAHLLKPGGRVTWRPDVEPVVDESPIFSPRSSVGTDDQALTAFREVWSAVIGDTITRSDGLRVLLGLSGGLDSRAVAAQYAQLGESPLTYTYGTRANREVVAATAVAERLGLPHVTVPVSDEHLLAGGADAVHLLDGAHAPTEMYELWYEGRLRSLTEVVVNGLAGGSLWGDDRLFGLTDGQMMADRVWARYAGGAAAAATFLVPGLAADLESAVRAAIEDSVARLQEVDRADVGIFWRIATRQVRWGNNLMTALRRAGIRPETPFLDGRFLRFAAGLTPQQRRHGRLYLRAQREVFSETADLPRGDDGNSPEALNHVYWSGDESYAAQLAELARRHPISATRRATRHAIGVGADALRERTGVAGLANRLETRSWVFPADVFVRTRPVYADRLAHLLDVALEVPDLFDEAAVGNAISNLRSGRGVAAAGAVGKVATLAGWVSDYRSRRAAFGESFGS